MDPLQEEKNPEDNLNDGSVEVDDKINEGDTACLGNINPDEKDVTTSSLITDENNSPTRELKDDTAENYSPGPEEFSNVIVPEKSEEDVKSVTASFLITDEKSSAQEFIDDPENNNPVEVFKSSEKIEEECKRRGDVMEIVTSVNVTVTRETDVNDATASLITDANNVPQEFSLAPQTVGEEVTGYKLVEEVAVIKTELSTEDKNQEEKPEELNNKDDSDDDSVDSSSDSSASSSSSSGSSTSGSSSDDEMDVDNDDVDDDVVELPKKLSPVIEEKPEELKEIQENGENPSIPDFPIYRDNDGESSHNSSSEDSTSSASDVDDNTTDQPPKQKSSSRKDNESEERSRPRIKGEIFPEELPALENLNICVGDDVDLQMLGKITSVIMNIAVVRAEFASPIDQDSFVFLKDRTCIGKVHDIIGQVLAPFYTILLDKDNVSIAIDTEIYCAPKEEEYTKYVFVSDLRNLKGSDASWEHDIEPPNLFLDYSDDEQERVIKKTNKCKNSSKANGDSKDNSGNGKSLQKDKSASGWSSTFRAKKWRKTGYQGGANSNTFQDASQRSMFACNTAWPPGNGHGSITSWPPPTPPPMPPTPPPTHFQQPNNPTFYPNGQPSHPTWHSNYPQPPNPPVGMMQQQPQQHHPFQSPWNPHQNPSNMDPHQHPHQHHPQNRPPFIPPPPNQQPWFHGQWRPPYNPQGPPRPPGSFDYMRYPLPRFSQPPQFPGFYP